MTLKETLKRDKTPYTLTLRGHLVTLSRPLVMGILNLTPDSFFAGSRTLDSADAVRRARAILDAGADIIDIGACSTRPGSEPVSEEEEKARLSDPLQAIRDALPDALISVDTFRSGVAKECLERWKADIINDISGGDDEMYAVVARYGAGYVLMHNRGLSAKASAVDEVYLPDVVTAVVGELAFKVDMARAAGVCNLIVDPGFGFAKSTEQNLALLGALERLQVLGAPVLAGISRKRMAREAAGCDAAEALVPTVALNTVALMKGAQIIRVHDVAEGVLTAKTIEKLWLASE